MLDKILVDAAAQAGVEVRERFSMQELVFEGNRVTGMRGQSDGGSPVTERARIVVGADGGRRQREGENDRSAQNSTGSTYHHEPDCTGDGVFARAIGGLRRL